MPEPNRVVIDRVDWTSVLPVLRLASALKHALQPGKLIVALLAVLAIHFSGTVFDWFFFEADEGVYAELVGLYTDGAAGLVASSFALNLSPDEMDSVPNLLVRMVFELPARLFDEHPWFTLLFGADVLFVLAMASGILTRMASTQVCGSRLTSLGNAVSSVRQRWVWYVLTPLMPAALIAVVGAVLALAGLAFFNLPGLDIAGSALFGLLILLGFVVAVVGLLLLLALFLMPPALSVEGSDGFDAIARSFNYILFRPWQFAVYLFASILYLAVVFVLVFTVAGFSLDAVKYFVGLGLVSDYEPTEASEWLAEKWLGLVTAIVTAILFSTYCCLQTQVYVLMRRSADGTPIDQCDSDDAGDLWKQQPVIQSVTSPTGSEG